MSTFIYSPTALLVETTYLYINETDQASNDAYYSIAITGDGYFYTHGKKFRLFNVSGSIVSGISFSISNGNALLTIDGNSAGSGSVISNIVGDTIINSVVNNGVASLTHRLYLNEIGQFGSALKIPIILVDKYGHITSIGESNQLDFTLVKANILLNQEKFYLIGVTNDTLQNPIYNTGIYIDSTGNLHVNDLYYNSSSISNLFAPLSHIDIIGNGTTYGHLKLSDIANIDNDNTGGIAATPKLVYQAIQQSKSYTESLIAAQDSMIFVGTLNSTGVITSHNSDVLLATDNETSITDISYKVGWTFRFTNSGTFSGEDVEPGDMIIAVNDKGQNFSIYDWTIIQTNINGALTATSNLNGLLLANNSRVILSLSIGSGVLKANGSSLEFVNPNTLWRDIQVNGTSIGTNSANISAGSNISITESNGTIIINANSSSIIGNSASLILSGTNTTFTYNPSSSAELSIGDGLFLINNEGDFTLLHSSTLVTVTDKLGKITTDNFGHITGFTEITSLKNPYKLLISNALNQYLNYDGSVEKTIKFAGDVSITITEQNNETLITTGITLSYRPISILSSLELEIPTRLINSDVNTTLTLVAGSNISFDTIQELDGSIVISAEDTWRAVYANTIYNNLTSIELNSLVFGNNFVYDSNAIKLAVKEISSTGSTTYGITELVTIATEERFNILQQSSAISNESFTFILETGQLYTHGLLFNAVSFGNTTDNYVPLNIAGTTKNVSLFGHTHSNYYAVGQPIDTISIVSGEKSIISYINDSIYIGNASNPTYLYGTLKTIKNNTEYTILDTNNFSIENKTITGTTLLNVATFKYGTTNYLLDYVKRQNVINTLDNLATHTNMGTTNEDSIPYGFLTMYTDGDTLNPKYAQVRININNNTIETRSSSSTTWKSLLSGGSYKNMSINGVTYSIASSSNSLPNICAPTSPGTGFLKCTYEDNNIVWSWDNNTYNNYTLPTAAFNVLGGVKTGEEVADVTGMIAVHIKEGVIYYRDTNTWIAWSPATNQSDGIAGYMPAPTSALKDLFLRGDGTWQALNNYSLPTASNTTLGGIKTGEAITDITGYTPLHIKDGIAYYKDTIYTFKSLLFTDENDTSIDTYSPVGTTKTIKAGNNVLISAENDIITINAITSNDPTTSLSRAAADLVKDTWSDVGTFAGSNGTWIVLFTVDDSLYSGVFSFKSDDTMSEEINLHASGTSTKRIYARTAGNKFQIVTDATTFSMPATTFNFRKLI